MTNLLIWLSDYCECGINDAYGIICIAVIVFLVVFVAVTYRVTA